MNSYRITVIFMFILGITFMSGCASMPQSSSSSYSSSAAPQRALPVAATLRFEDVPIPAGFKLLDAESFAFRNDETRVALLKYAGSKPPEQLVAFYKDQMPLYNWSPLNIIEYERRILNYEKKEESCIVTIESKGFKSILTIAVSPKSRPMEVKEREEK